MCVIVCPLWIDVGNATDKKKTYQLNERKIENEEEVNQFKSHILFGECVCVYYVAAAAPTYEAFSPKTTAESWFELSKWRDR